VLYKPNPFSIAKINVACRARPEEDGADDTSRKKLTKEKITLKAKATKLNLKGDVLDGCKKQAERLPCQLSSVGALKPGLAVSKHTAELGGRTLAKLLAPLPAKTAISKK
jgi:hypothetical protein